MLSKKAFSVGVRLIFPDKYFDKRIREKVRNYKNKMSLLNLKKFNTNHTSKK